MLFRSEVVREAQLFCGQDLRGNDTEDGPWPLAVPEGVGAEAREARHVVGEVGVVFLGEFLADG